MQTFVLNCTSHYFSWKNVKEFDCRKEEEKDGRTKMQAEKKKTTKHILFPTSHMLYLSVHGKAL